MHFHHSDAQKQEAIASRDALTVSRSFDAPIVTEITARTVFYPAEDYHPDYYRKQELRYQAYRAGCDRDAKLHRLHRKYGAGRSVPILASCIDDDGFHHRVWRLLVKTPRDASLLKARLERTLKKTNSRIVAGWSDPRAQKARIEQRIASLTPA